MRANRGAKERGGFDESNTGRSNFALERTARSVGLQVRRSARRRSARALGAMKVVSVALVACVFGCSSASEPPDEQPQSKVGKYTVCELPTKGAQSIGRIVAVRGEIILGTEFVALLDEKCPDILVSLELSEGGPSVTDCIFDGPKTNCGGLDHDGQTVTAVGVLRRMTTLQRAHKDRPMIVAALDVMRYETEPTTPTPGT